MTSGSASLTKVRSRLSILPRQSPSSLILSSIIRDGDFPFSDPLFLMMFLSFRSFCFFRLTLGITGLRQMGITAHVLILAGAAIDHNPLCWQRGKSGATPRMTSVLPNRVAAEPESAQDIG